MDWFSVVFILDIWFLVVLPHYFGIPFVLHMLILFFIIVYVPSESIWFRSLSIWEYFRKEYFKFTLKGPGVKYLEDKDNQYIFAIHKHGVYSVSNIMYFALNRNMLHVRSVGTSLLFTLPLIKEFVGLAGTVRANKEDIIETLDRGYSVAMSPGGIREVPGMTEGSPIIEREGFLKISLQKDIPVVPIYAEGEEELYDCHIYYPKVARLLLKWFYYPICLITVWGNPLLPFWPKKHPITLYIGEPIRGVELGQFKKTFYEALQNKK